MITEIVTFSFLVLSNGGETMGISVPTMEECQEQHAEVMKIPDILAISDCAQVTLKGVK